VGRAGAAARTVRRARGVALIAAGLAFAAPAHAAPMLVTVGQFSNPTYATGAPGDGKRVFVTERGGHVRVVDGTVRDFLDVTSITNTDGDERGLLSMAFALDYATSGRFYVYLTAAGGELQIREYRRSATDPDAADPASGRLLLAIPHSEAPNHNGGQLQIGPDGKLWIGTGDGGGGNNQFGHSQDPGSLLGKLIRLDPNAPTPEIVSVGLRNPWRFSFDRANGELWIGDVGQDQMEEIDHGVAGNYGWSCFEGTRATGQTDARCASAAAMPVLTKTHSGDGFCSITGGYVVRDPGLPTLLGRYLYSDYCAGALRSFAVGNPGSDAPVGNLEVQGLSSFGEDACGRIFVASLDGPVYRLVDGALSPCGAPASTAPVADTTACRFSARVTGLRSVRRERRFSVALRSDEACRATVRARIKGVASFRRAQRSLGAGRRSVVRVRLTARGARAVRRALIRHRSLRVALTIRAVDAAGNTRTLTRTLRVRG
jgi:Glucose / Sorbosone dehydrogenase